MTEIKELTHKELVERLTEITERYDFVKLSYIGRSVLGRAIPVVTIGEDTAKKGVLYVSTHHAAENICTSVTVKFIEEYADYIEKGRYAYGLNTRVLYKMRKIHIVPMLNPDGVEYRLYGVDEGNPLRERLLQYNGSEDFSDWNANGRGVDLNHNYNAYFGEYKKIEADNNVTAGKTRYSGEAPESEPETAALASYIRFNEEKINGILTFHTQGEEIFCKSRGESAPKSDFIARRLAKMTGYSLSEAEGMASYGGLTDWFIKEFNKPSFTLECGRGHNPLDISLAENIYFKLRESLFTFPVLI